ncbi:glycosyltransferase family 4 protein [Haloarcula nitratireducens]|uniref:Glycosyltransferase family 4 protein n=1 Tax=Haloarcula nitratireducens TaxID=2487749 RepID=A0AAW4PER3_9EURY|nr:glycosyltransferase family 4 protein [Halomicroarcula nitratireducens]MBX0295752.1 glycosyltransferase family 4 protein [Halomicroarcula nitratireducens]
MTETAVTDGSDDQTDRPTLDVGFIPAECPGTGAVGATRTSELLIQRLSHHHDLTVYVASQAEADPERLPARGRVEYVLHDGLAKLPHPLLTKLDAMREEVDALSTHDMVHTYSPGFIPILADLDVPTLSTLNSYLPACPKGDFRYYDGEKCTGHGTAKCINCIAHADVDRRKGVENSLRSAYSSLGKVNYVDDAMTAIHDVDAFQALSPHIKDDYANMGVERDRITVVPHFYDDEFYHPEWDEPLDDSDGLTLLHVGRLQENKGQESLVRAMPRLLSNHEDLTLRVAGSGGYEEGLHELARQLGVDHAIDWLGYVDHDDVPPLYADADAFVYPGLLDEPFGRVLLEALGTYTPVLASDVGSTDYIVGDAGVRFEAGDPAALADGFGDLVADYERHRAAIPEQLERFAPDTVESAFLDLYEEVAETRTPATASH